MSSRFHKAAKDGLLEVLKDASRKDANSRDEDSMTPVLWAAFEGRLDALRLLCGKGGDPDKCDQFGNTALHLASAMGHLHCVHFLISFGVNLYSLDVDKHNAKDLAAINNRDDVLRYLDNAMAHFEANERKKAKEYKEIAEKNCEKHIREFIKKQQKPENEESSVKATSSRNKSTNVLWNIKQKLWSSQNQHKSGKDHDINNVSKFSDLTITENQNNSDCCTSNQSKTAQIKARNTSNTSARRNPKIKETEEDDQLKTSQQNSEVVYSGTFNTKNAGELHEPQDDQIDGDTENLSNFKPKAVQEFGTQANLHQVFNKPIIGSLAFRRSITAALDQLQSESYQPVMTTVKTVNQNQTSVLNVPQPRLGERFFHTTSDDSDSEGGDVYSEDDQDIIGSPMKGFLAVWGLDEYAAIFKKQQIDLDTLMLLTESDLKSLGLPLGPFRKLMHAIHERKNALINPGVIKDSSL